MLSGCSWSRPHQSPNHPASWPPQSCPSSACPSRRSKATESLSTGLGPIRGRNTQHKRLLLDQPSRVVPGIVFQLSYSSLPVCQFEEKDHCRLPACWEFLFYWTQITRNHNDRGCFLLFCAHQFEPADLSRRTIEDCKWIRFLYRPLKVLGVVP